LGGGLVIKINNWSKYQSYKDRKPPWIRFHRSILDDYQFQMMSANARATLPMLWLLACEDADPTSGMIKLSYAEISFRLRQKEKDIKATIEELQRCEFIECIETVTKPLRDSNQIVTPETETETETEGEIEAKIISQKIASGKKVFVEDLKEGVFKTLGEEISGKIYKRFGDHVVMTKKQAEKLTSDLGGWKVVEAYIERCNDYCASRGKVYKDYAATIRGWYRRDNPEDIPKPKKKTELSLHF